MTYNCFVQILKEVRPDIELVTHHGGMAGTRCKSSVAVTFVPNGKVYEYRGGYAAVLYKLRVPYRYRVSVQGEHHYFYTAADAEGLARLLSAQVEQIT